ncbi:hypothetical protein [Tardiphaga sp. 839_C3_N1_4]|uniref:hypothetical protein n=1 Tax=Tardiphaga sp. 839_C3_N1_4 TaxID=3240761 RepID=UPI003F2187D4
MSAAEDPVIASRVLAIVVIRSREKFAPVTDAQRFGVSTVASCSRPWSADGFGSFFNKAKIDAKMAGTAATKFYVAGFTMREIAETLAWEEESVEKIIRRYVGRAAAMKARIRKLEARQ